jgi:hypothetical protein
LLKFVAQARVQLDDLESRFGKRIVNSLIDFWISTLQLEASDPDASLR